MTRIQRQKRRKFNKKKKNVLKYRSSCHKPKMCTFLQSFGEEVGELISFFLSSKYKYRAICPLIFLMSVVPISRNGNQNFDQENF